MILIWSTSFDKHCFSLKCKIILYFKNIKMLCHSEVRLFINNITRTLFNFWSFCLNQIQPSVAFHIQTSHLICYVNQMTDFYMKCITRLPWVNRTYLCIPPQDFLENLQNCCILSSILESVTRGVLKIFTKFLRRHLCHSHFFNKVAG